MANEIPTGEAGIRLSGTALLPELPPERLRSSSPGGSAREIAAPEMTQIVRGLAGRLHARLPRGCGIEMSDLIQAGNVGLLKATINFEESYGAPLAGYARFRIRGEMLDMVRRNAGKENSGSASRPAHPGGEDSESMVPASEQVSRSRIPILGLAHM